MSIVESLVGIVGAKGIVTDAAEMQPYLTDWRGKLHGAAVAVVRPSSTAEVAAIARTCSSQGIAMVPQGGNTGLAGGATPDRSGDAMVVSLDRMSAIRAVDPVDNVIELEAGCILQTAQQAAAEAGRLLPLSFAAEGSARVGGVIATNAGGINVLRYGNTRPNVLGLEVVLADGTILDLMGRLRKDNAGYDLKQLFIGSEGTLGLITAAVLRLQPRIAQTHTAVLQLSSLDAVLALYSALNADLGEFLSSFELISPQAAALATDHLPAAHWPFSTGWAVLLEAGSGNAALDLHGLVEAALADAIERGIVADAVIAQNEAQRASFWRVRESITEGERAAGPSIKHDVSVPLSRLPGLIAACEARLMEAFPGIRPNIFGHVGDGNLHFNLIPTPAQAAEADLVARVNALVHDMVDAAGGSITAEHGVGQLRVAELERYKPPAALALMRTLKQALDPAGLMNPGKVIGTGRA